MTQGSLWLPGFEFADGLTADLPTNPSKTLEAAPLPEQFELTATPVEVQAPQVADAVNTFEEQQQSFAGPATITVKSATAEAAVFAAPPWPLLTADAHSALGGVVSKFEANVRAIELLRDLEAKATQPDMAQRAILNNYTGWGGIKQPFDQHPRDEWLGRAKQITKLLTDEEYNSARDSTLNAHYTPLPVVHQIWSMLKSMGFNGGRILEMSAGVGYFLGGMPSDIAQRSSVTAVELDDLTARFLKMLYGQRATVHHKGFEAVNLPEGYFDLSVSNVPFGNYGVPDTRRKPYSNFHIHNYFIARALDLVRPGGLVAVITSAFFMDNASETVREYVARKAKLVGAIRMPSGTFSRIASTDVVADIILLQKRFSNEVLTADERDAWIETATLLGADGEPLLGANRQPQKVNQFWNFNPEAVVGTWSANSRIQGQQITPVLEDNMDLTVELERASKLIANAVYEPSKEITKEVCLTAQESDGSLLPGSFVVKNGEIFRQEEFGLVPSTAKGKKAERIAALAAIRDTVQLLIKEQCKTAADEQLMNSLRFKLNTQYESLVANHGIITSKGNRLAMGNDPAWPLLLSLEYYDEETESASKADIFFERTIFSKEVPKSAETPEDALAICMAELGCLDEGFIGALLARDGKEILLDLASSGAVFLDPVSLVFIPASEYLSGNVRHKLEIAQDAGIAFHQNVEALKRSLPKDLSPNDIDVMPGANWLPLAITEQFLMELVHEEWSGYSWAKAEIKLEPATGHWSVTTCGPMPAAMTTKWGTRRIDGFALFQQCMNQIDAEVFDTLVDDRKVLNGVETATARLKQDELKQEFRRWLWSDDTRAQALSRLYNDTFNCWSVQKFDGSRLRLPGYSHALQLREHQLNAIARMATGKNILLAHVVGAGKSVTMICGSMELRRLGIAKKPFHVVPNHCLEQYVAEFMRAYPNANVLMATSADFDKDRRQTFVARCATGNWDAVVMTHSMFERIYADPEITEQYVGEILSELRGVKSAAANNDRGAMRAVTKFIKDWEARLEKLKASWKKDKLITLAATGCDYVVFDECHVAKNLFRISNMKSIAGLNNSNSQRSFDLLLKTAQIMRLHGDTERGLCQASGTVVSNSMAEMHVSQRYLQPFTLKSMGLDKFDPWAAQFGRAVNSLEVSPDGSSFRMNRRFKKFVNMPELMGLFRQVADIQTKEMLKLPTPPLVTGSHQICTIKPSDAVKAFVQDLVARAEAIRNRTVKPHEDNMLAITGDGQKVALDMRLVDPSAPFDPKGKIGKCVENVHRIWEQTAGFKGTQLVFSDMGTPTGKSLNVYKHIRMLLIAKGVPAHEIAFIHEAATPHAKSALFAKIRAGMIRVLLGSTSKCGMGTNIQTRLYAVHHLTTPWRPSDIEQRDGRIERQGNTCEAIEIWRYVVEGTFDAYMWQTLSAKAGFVAQVMSGNAEVRTIEDAMMATLSYDEVKAIACGNPAVREKATVDAEIMNLSLKKRQHDDNVWRARSSLWSLPKEIENARDRATKYRVFADDISKASNDLKLDINGKTFNDEEKVRKILTLSIADFAESKKEKSRMLGVLNGARIEVLRTFEGDVIYAHSLDLHVREKLGQYKTGESVIRKLKELAAAAPAHADELAGTIHYLEKQEPLLQKRVDAVFEEEQRLSDLIARAKQIAVEMGLFKNMEGTEAIAEGAQVTSTLAAELAAELAGDVDADGGDTGGDTTEESEALEAVI